MLLCREVAMSTAPGFSNLPASAAAVLGGLAVTRLGGSQEAIFLSPGSVPAADGEKALPCFPKQQRGGRGQAGGRLLLGKMLLTSPPGSCVEGRGYEVRENPKGLAVWEETGMGTQ